MATTEPASAAPTPRTFTVGDARFTVVTDAILRLEHCPDRGFEDRPTLAFPKRNIARFTPTVTLRSADGGEAINADTFAERGGVLDTADLTLRYDPAMDEGRFTARSLEVTLKRPPHTSWTPGAGDDANLGGTTRTLDNISGACPVENGLVSRDGWALHDDSHLPVLEPPAPGEASWHGEPWPRERRAHEDAIDWTLFAHGLDFTRCLREFTAIAGRIPLPPRYALGVWWSRYWRYTDKELKEIVTDFERHGVPLDVLVIDMDWHLPGWTGYTWDRSCFPDPEGFLGWCHDKQLAVTLNLHPADGVGRHEEVFLRFRQAVGGDRTVYRVPFDCTDPAFVKPYFELLHHPLERQGVDFWWMDWQQGTETRIANLDPLPWLNHLHRRDMEINPERRVTPHHADASEDATRHLRPLVFSRWGGLGGHRYPIGFSGDTYNDWPSLAFQPWFTATAANVGFGYWSHDIGGHQPGPVEPELYARWIQFGVLSPIVRTHAGNRADAERRVWTFTERTFDVAQQAFALRYELLPYIYAACREAFDSGVSLCRPMYYAHPDLDAAYRCRDQYQFGPDMIAAPACAHTDAVSDRVVVRAWLPQGSWTHWFTGRTYEVADPEGRDVAVLCPLDEIPLFVRAGAIVPTVPAAERVYRGAPELVRLCCFPFSAVTGDHAAGLATATLYDDDGVSDAYSHGECVRTPIAHERDGGNVRVTIQPADGDFPGFPDTRDYELRLRESLDADTVIADGEPLPRIDAPRAGAAAARGFRYDEHDRQLIVSLPRTPTRRRTEIAVTLADDPALEADLRSGLRGRLKRRAALPGDGSLADFCQRHGIACKLSAQPKDDGTIHARLEAHHVPDAPDAATIDIAVAWQPLSAFTPDDSTPFHDTSATLAPHASLVRELTLRPAGGVPGNDTLAARVDVTLNATGERRTLQPSLDLCPSINAWHAIGPFFIPFDDALRTPVGPERELLDTGSIDTSHAHGDPAAEEPDTAVRRWTRIARPASADVATEFVVDLNRALEGPHDYCVAYAVADVHAPRDTHARLVFGSDDGIVIWVNGREIFRHHIQRGYTPREQAVACDLVRGRNQIAVKVNQAEAGWMFAMHIEDDRGGPIPGLRFDGLA